MALNQPNPKQFLEAGENISNLAFEIARKSQKMQAIDEQAMSEFPEISQKTCEAGLAMYKDLVKDASELFFRLSAHEAKAYFYLPEGQSEGDIPPCDC